MCFTTELVFLAPHSQAPIVLFGACVLLRCESSRNNRSKRIAEAAETSITDALQEVAIFIVEVVIQEVEKRRFPTKLIHLHLSLVGAIVERY